MEEWTLNYAYKYAFSSKASFTQIIPQFFKLSAYKYCFQMLQVRLCYSFCTGKRCKQRNLTTSELFIWLRENVQDQDLAYLCQCFSVWSNYFANEIIGNVWTTSLVE